MRRLSETCRDHGVLDEDAEAAARATATMTEASSTLLGAGA